MKTIGYWIVFVTSLVFCFSAAGNEVVSETPSLYIPESTFDFQTVVSGTPVIHSYVVQNKGTGPLEITKVKTG